MTLKLPTKPDYMLFPELSIPLEWVNSISAKLSASGISLIAGTEYRHNRKNKVLSEAVLVMSDNRLGYPAFVKMWQPKLQPAVGEDYEIMAKFGKKWNYSTLKQKMEKPIYVHNGVNLGVMICSELQNAKARIKFQGAIDALMILSWNKDLETFSSLIEASALDIHAYMILVNNRKYGDSRVRSPAKESFMRDIARLRGGDNDFVVAATIDIQSLRAFQSRNKRWTNNDDKFKPVPEDFCTTHDRKVLPPS
jgi:predicted amidohydrolase